MEAGESSAHQQILLLVQRYICWETIASAISSEKYPVWDLKFRLLTVVTTAVCTLIAGLPLRAGKTVDTGWNAISGEFFCLSKSWPEIGGLKLSLKLFSCLNLPTAVQASSSDIPVQKVFDIALTVERTIGKHPGDARARFSMMAYNSFNPCCTWPTDSTLLIFGSVEREVAGTPVERSSKTTCDLSLLVITRNLIRRPGIMQPRMEWDCAVVFEIILSNSSLNSARL